jgi:hypothetical protein
MSGSQNEKTDIVFRLAKPYKICKDSFLLKAFKTFQYGSTSIWSMMALNSGVCSKQ